VHHAPYRDELSSEELPLEELSLDATEPFPPGLFRVPVPDAVFAEMPDLSDSALRCLLALVHLSFRFDPAERIDDIVPGLQQHGPAETENLPLFRTMTREKTLSERPMSRTSVLRMVESRAEAAGFDPSRVCCHTFRGTGITAYLENGGKLEVAQHLAGHADASTTKLYDRRKELVSKEEVEKIGI